MPKSGQSYERDVLSRSPLLAELEAFARPLLAGSRWPSLADYTAFAEAERRARAPELTPVRFAPAGAPRRRGRGRPALDLRQLYDGRIALAGEVPCLDASYHDLFNALVWAAFPRAKRALHARQFRALAGRWRPDATQLPNRRTPEQDALTIFDEGGAVTLALDAAGADAHAVGERPILFGHAVMEHVCFESFPVRSAVLRLPLGARAAAAHGRELFEAIDQSLARRLSDDRQLTSPAFDAVLRIEPPGAFQLTRDEPPVPQRARVESA